MSDLQFAGNENNPDLKLRFCGELAAMTTASDYELPLICDQFVVIFPKQQW